jgi:hypothetical protein
MMLVVVGNVLVLAAALARKRGFSLMWREKSPYVFHISIKPDELEFQKEL